MNQKSNNQKITVSYQGQQYEARYSTESGVVEVEIFFGDFHRKTTRQLGVATPESIARITALQILIAAKERGELNSSSSPNGQHPREVSIG